MWEPPCGGVVGSHPDRLGDQTAGGNPVRARRHSSWMPTPRCQCAVTRYASMADLRREMHPRGHGCATPLDRRAAGADRTGCARRPIAGGVDIQTRADGGLARRSEGSRGTTGQRRRPASKPRLSWRLRQSRWPGRHPGPYTVTRHRSRDAIGAEQEAVGPCRVRHATVAASDGKATASRGFTQQCGSESSSSKDGGSPSKTNRPTPARAADAAPGAVDPSRCTPATDAPAGHPGPPRFVAPPLSD